MEKRQFVLGVAFASFFGAAIALIITYFIGPEEKVYIPIESENKAVNFANYKLDSSDFVVPAGLNFIHASKVSTPAVVHIRTEYQSNRGGSQDEAFDRFFRDYFGGEGGGGQGGPARGAGSGVIVSSDGYIVTNNHVIEDASNVQVVLGDNRSYEGEVVGVDPTTDLALIKIAEKGLPTLNYGNSSNIQIGEWVLAVGNPFEFRSTVTAGIVSAKGRNINILRQRDGMQIESFIQTDAAVNPGNSGGALVNLRGELIGINTAIATKTGSFSGYSFAVPSSLVEKVVGDLKEFGEVRRALLGIRILDVTAELAEQEELSVLQGIFVSRVNGGSSADEAGLESGDVIVGIDDRTVNSVAELQESVAVNRPGDEITVAYMRDGKKRYTRAKLQGATETNKVVLASKVEHDGATFSELSDREKRNKNIPGGVKIENLGNGKWKDAGVKEGFVITEIDKKEISGIKDLERIIETYTDEEGVLVEGINSEGKVKYYGIDW